MHVKYPYSVKISEVHPNINVAWCDEGKGEKTILFIHGLAGYIPLWKNQIDHLKETYRCVAIDLPGNGLSPSGDFPYSMFFYAEIIARFIEKESLKNVTICGHSMGGHVSIILALRYPQLIQKLILVASSGLEVFASHEVIGMKHFMDIGQYFYSNSSQVDSTIKQSFYRENTEAAQIIADLKKIMKIHSLQKWNSMISVLIKAMLNEPVHAFLNTLNLPVLIIFGEKDEFIPNKLIHPLETVKSIAANASTGIKDSKVHLIRNAGHFVHIEKYEEVNTLVQQFV